MGFFGELTRGRQISRRERDVAFRNREAGVVRDEMLLSLYEDRELVMEDIQSSWRGLGNTLRFGIAYSGGDFDQIDQKDLIGVNVLENRIKQSRVLVRSNPFARSAITNLKHYVVGESGLQFHLNDPAAKSIAPKANEVWNRWMSWVGFIDMQHEILQRVLRDGACYIRWFGTTPRFVSPLLIAPPPGGGEPGSTEQKWGIVTSKDDVQTREFYWVKRNPQDINPEKVPADEIDYLNWKDADANVLRPSPILFDFIEYLTGAAGVIKNMRELVRIQTAIAIIREHPEGTSGSQIASWATARAGKTVDDPDDDSTRRQEKWHAGTIMDTRHGSKVHFPAAQMNVEKMVAALQADLRAVAAALGLPEFIFTADAASSNYASLMAAEGPAVKTFKTLQGWMGRYLKKAFWRIMLAATSGGVEIPDVTGKVERFALPGKVVKLTCTVNGPSVKTRDQFSEARTDAIYAGLGVISPQEIAQAQGRDYGETMRLIEEHNKLLGQDFIIPWPPGQPEELDTDQETGSEKRNAGDAEK